MRKCLRKYLRGGLKIRVIEQGLTLSSIEGGSEGDTMWMDADELRQAYSQLEEELF